MGLTSLQASMDPSDWLQGTMCDDGGIDSSSPSPNDMLACSRPLMERRLRPPHDQALKCPRCESTNTKFCYYNNYSLTQPRYFCKTCRRYWTKGGTLRNIPVGGGCRKNKRQPSSGSKKMNTENQNSATSGTQIESQGDAAANLQLCFPETQLNHHHITGLIGGGIAATFLDNKYQALLDRHSGYEGFLGSKFDALMGNPTTRAHDLLGPTNIGLDFGGDNLNGITNNFINTLSSTSSPFGLLFEGNASGVLDSSYQRLTLPYDYNHNHNHNLNSNGQDHHQGGVLDVKPGPKLLSLQWQENNGSGNVGNREPFGYNGGFNGFSSWGVGNMLNGYAPSSTANTLI